MTRKSLLALILGLILIPIYADEMVTLDNVDIDYYLYTYETQMSTHTRGDFKTVYRTVYKVVYEYNGHIIYEYNVDPENADELPARGKHKVMIPISKISKSGIILE